MTRRGAASAGRARALAAAPARAARRGALALGGRARPFPRHRCVGAAHGDVLRKARCGGRAQARLAAWRAWGCSLRWPLGWRHRRTRPRPALPTCRPGRSPRPHRPRPRPRPPSPGLRWPPRARARTHPRPSLRRRRRPPALRLRPPSPEPGRRPRASPRLPPRGPRRSRSCPTARRPPARRPLPRACRLPPCRPLSEGRRWCESSCTRRGRPGLPRPPARSIFVIPSRAACPPPACPRARSPWPRSTFAIRSPRRERGHAPPRRSRRKPSTCATPSGRGGRRRVASNRRSRARRPGPTAACRCSAPMGCATARPRVTTRRGCSTPSRDRPCRRRRATIAAPCERHPGREPAARRRTPARVRGVGRWVPGATAHGMCGDQGSTPGCGRRVHGSAAVASARGEDPAELPCGRVEAR